MKKTQDVLFERQGDVGILTFNRPDRLNAISAEMITTSLRLLQELTEGRTVRALLIKGGGPGFCSGADLTPNTAGVGGGALEDSAGTLGDAMKKGLNPLILGLQEAPFPVVGAVTGASAGAGVGLALACDFIIAGPSTRLILTFSRIGMGLDGGTSWFLSHMLGQKRAAAVSLLMEPITSDQLKDWGIAWSVVADDEVDAEALKLAARLAKGATRSYAAQKSQLKRALEIDLATALEEEADIQDVLVASDDLKEGIAAYREKRPAVYTGR